MSTLENKEWWAIFFVPLIAKVLDHNDSYNYVNLRVCIRIAYRTANTGRNTSNTSATNTNSTNPDSIEFLSQTICNTILFNWKWKYQN